MSVEIRILRGTGFKANSTQFGNLPYSSRIIVYADHKMSHTAPVMTFDYESLRAFIQETAKHAGFTLMEAKPFSNYQLLQDDVEQAEQAPVAQAQPSSAGSQDHVQHEAKQAVPQG